MEAGSESYFAAGIDADRRNASLEIVREADDARALLAASCEHFNNSTSLLKADRVLEEFRDEELAADLKNTIGFDPELFKACVLFELSHLEDDDSTIPEHVQRFADFWKGTPETTRDFLEQEFTAETKRSRYEPFPVMSQFVVLSIAIQATNKYMEEIRALSDDSPADPMQDEIDGKQYRIFLGGQELKADEPPVLTQQLQRDLGKFLPHPVLNELRYRFPDDATFEDLNPLIERIKHERANDIMPSEEELVTCYRRLGRRAVAAVEKSDDLDRAREFFIDVHRSLRSRIFTHDIYVPGVGAWYVVQTLESDTEHSVFYRRIFYGDMTTKEIVEVPLDQRQPVLDELERKGQEVGEYPGRLQDETVQVYDVVGSYYQG